MGVRLCQARRLYSGVFTVCRHRTVASSARVLMVMVVETHSTRRCLLHGRRHPAVTAVGEATRSSSYA